MPCYILTMVVQIRTTIMTTSALIRPKVLIIFALLLVVAAALFFGPLFFPSYSPAAQTLLSFMSFGIAFIARPFGAV